MRRAILGAVVGAALAVAAVVFFDHASEVLAQRVTTYPPAIGGSDLIAVPSTAGDKGQLLTVIDARNHTIGVYGIEPSSGKITLRSVRNISWDLEMMEFNSDTPSPKQIRSQLGR
jgi:hypothetical protein